jgi:uncharacterized protein YmfQ (DUF2313 family)
MAFLDPVTLEEQTQILAQYLRNDRLHCLKSLEGSNIYKVLFGLAAQFIVFRDMADRLYEEYDPSVTTDLIAEWETFVGIPDSCISNTDSLDQRRKNILLKLMGIEATTAKQFKDTAEAFGYSNITVEPAAESSATTFPYTFPIVLLSEAELPFTIIVTMEEKYQPQVFPLTFPITLSDPGPTILSCLFEKLKPAHTKIIFRYK